MRRRDLGAIIPPIDIRLDKARVRIWEVTKTVLATGEVWYLVHLQVFYRRKASRRFTLPVRSWDELVKKLLVEIPKFKLMVLMGYET
ncbi:MAG: hypothetical protein DRJ69_02670 [Thermoprotei archaeon]|nr:MAG: hypothetical protein DRJ69_02670 [Thermoprotei archaeon]